MNLRKITILAAVLTLTACSSSANTKTPSETSVETTLETETEIMTETTAETTSETASETEAETTSETASETEAETTSETASETEAETTSKTASETERVFTVRDDLHEYLPLKETERVKNGSAYYIPLREYNYVSLEFSDEEIISLIENAYDIYYYGMKKGIWGDYVDFETAYEDYHPTGISYEKFYNYISEIFTEDLIEDIELGKYDYSGQKDENTRPCIMQNDGELFWLPASTGDNAGLIRISLFISEETDEKIIISGEAVGDGGDKEITYNVDNAFVILKTPNGLRVDEYYPWL